MTSRPVQLGAALLLAASGAAFLGTRLPPPVAIDGLETAEGVEATLFASAPMITNPIAMDVDARGRVWVTEGHNYRNTLRPNYPNRQEGDRIVILEDTDGDGKADTQKTFYQGADVNAALGIAVLGDQVIVSAYENVFVFRDTDGDDRADEKTVLFKRQRADHDHTTHSFVFGPDGRIYFNAGDAGGPLMDPTGKVLTDKAGYRILPDSGVYRRGMVFRLNRDFSGVEVIGHNFRNPFELALDSYGNVWQSDNDDDGNRAVRINYVMEYGNYGYRNEMTGADWRTRRVGMESTIPQQHWHLNDPGVVPNVLLTGAGSPTGMTFYEGDLLPAVFRNTMIHADAGPNVVRAYPTELSGAGFTARSVPILRSTTDPLFRPADVTVAADGSLFVTDWYDQGVGGHAAQNFDQGRIIRLSPRGNTAYRSPRVDVSTAAGAIQALRNPAVSVRYLGYTKLAELGAAAEAPLRQLWADRNPRMRARALWLLAQMPNGQRYLGEALRDPNPDIRITGLRATRMVNATAMPVLERLAADPSPHVRREVAVALRYERGPEAARIWTQLARQYDGVDRWYLEALGVAADDKWDTFLPVWRAAVGEAWREKPGRDIVWRARSEAALPLLSQLILDPSTTPADRERYFRSLDFYRGPARERTLMQVVEASGADARTTALALTQLDSASIQMTPQLRATVDRTLAGMRGTQQFVDLASKFDARTQQEELLRLALVNPDSTKGVAAARLALRWGGIDPLRAAAVGSDASNARAAVTLLGFLGGADAQRVVESVVLDASRPLALRQQAVASFARMAAGGNQPPAQGATLMGDRRLLQIVQRDSLATELRDAAAAVLFASPRADVREGAAGILTAPSTVRTADGRTLPPTAQLAARTGDRANGRTAYAKACVICHIAEGVGSDFGPPLTEIGSKLPKPALYTAILSPSQGIAYNYEGWIVRLKDGRETTGIIVNDTQTELAVKVIGGIVTRYSKADVESVVAMPVSLMPPNLHTALTEQELVDLVEYLASLRSPAR